MDANDQNPNSAPPGGLDIQNKRNYLYALVLAVYRVTDKFPPEEHLRLKMREEAVNILSHVEHIYAGQETERYERFINSIQTLVHYCEVASEQKWLHETNFEVLKHELFKLRNSFEMPEQVEPLKEGSVKEASYEVDLRDREASSSVVGDAPPTGGTSPTTEEASKETTPTSSLDSKANRAIDLRKVSAGPLYHGIYPGIAENEEAETQQEEEASSSLEIPERPRRSPELAEGVQLADTRASKEAGEGPVPHLSEGKVQGLTERQKSIIIHLREAEAAQVADLSNILPDVSPRTIRRDLDVLIGRRLIEKKGKTNGARYKLA